MKALRWVRRAAKAAATYLPDFRDLHVYGGVVLAAAGLERLHPGLGWAWAGLCLAAIGVGLHHRIGGG